HAITALHTRHVFPNPQFAVFLARRSFFPRAVAASSKIRSCLRYFTLPLSRRCLFPLRSPSILNRVKFHEQKPQTVKFKISFSRAA
ncbi:hypothetical protein, partial [uncultured Campylobacter sp.]|uniref:hypothetical protein n=1 Tax=uncultured Campylobacter sp. TaxID=218934 RepID=UPI00260EF371